MSQIQIKKGFLPWSKKASILGDVLEFTTNFLRFFAMTIRWKHIVMVAGVGLFTWVSWGIYNYFFDASMPQITVIGLEPDHAFAGDVACIIASTKAGEISLWLDGQPLINQFRMSAKEQGHQFTIPTKTLGNGKHSFKALLTDNTYNKNKIVDERIFYVDNLPLQAAFVQSEPDYKVFQGRTLHVQFQVNKPIKDATVLALSNSFNCFPESKNSLVYECFVPIACEENPNEYLFSVDITDQVGNSLHLDNKFQVVIYPFKKQSLQVSQEIIKQEEQMGIQAKKLDELLEDLTKKSPAEKLWRGAFCAPIDIMRISCEFGTVRTTQHKGRYAHKAVDIINHPRSAVWAPQDGVVVLMDRFEHSGNTVVIDHGLGILTVFFHLDSFAKISVGDKIAKGNLVGTLGKTGYATGYHLHWAHYVNNIPVDPMQWTKTTF